MRIQITISQRTLACAAVRCATPRSCCGARGWARGARSSLAAPPPLLLPDWERAGAPRAWSQSYGPAGGGPLARPSATPARLRVRVRVQRGRFQ